MKSAKKTIDWQRQSSRSLTALAICLIPVLGVWYHFSGRGMEQRYFYLMVAGHALLLIGGFLGRYKTIFFYLSALGIGMYFVGHRLDGDANQRARHKLCDEIRHDRYCVSNAEGFNCRAPGRLGDFYIAHTECPAD